MNILTDTQLEAAKAALEAGKGVAQFLDEEEFDVQVGKARQQLFKKYGRETLVPLLRATIAEDRPYMVAKQCEAILKQKAMKGKKTKFKSTLKSLINAL